MKVKSESEVAQSYLTLCNPMDRSPPGSSIHGIFQARYWSGLPLPSLSQGHSRSLIPSLISVESLVTLVEQILSAFSQFPNESIYSVRVCVYFQLHYRFIMSSKRQSYLPSILTTITQGDTFGVFMNCRDNIKESIAHHLFGKTLNVFQTLTFKSQFQKAYKLVVLCNLKVLALVTCQQNYYKQRWEGMQDTSNRVEQIAKLKSQ